MPWDKAQSIGPIPAPSFYDQFISRLMQNAPQGNERNEQMIQQMGQAAPSMNQMMPMMMGGASPIRPGGAGPSQSVLMDIYNKMANRGRIPLSNPVPITQGIVPGSGMRPSGLPVNDNTYQPLNVLRDPQVKGFLANPLFGRR